jgi:hypothetical protein
MRSITISVDEELAQTIRVEAAKSGQSMSKYLAEAALEKIANDNLGAKSKNERTSAMQKFLAGPRLHIAIDGRMPTADERNAR